MRSFNTHQINVEHQGLTVEYYLKNILQYSGRKVQKLTRLRGIQLNNKTVFLQKKLKAGEILSVLVLEDQSYGVLPEKGSLEILYEDSKVIVLNKPPNILVHPAGKTTDGTMANYLAYYFQQKGEVLKIRPLHRLDRDTSGCVVFAKDAQTQTILEKQLQSGILKRSYYALVEGVIEPGEGAIDAPIGRHSSMPNRRQVTEDGERAVTYYRTLKQIVVEGLRKISLLELKLETGRTHQIRVHLAHLGYPVIGDRMYGKASSLISRQALHAESISYTEPNSSKEIIIKAPIPPDFVRII